MFHPSLGASGGTIVRVVTSPAMMSTTTHQHEDAQSVLDKHWKTQLAERGCATCVNKHCQLSFLSFAGVKAHFGKCAAGITRTPSYVECGLCHLKFGSYKSLAAHQKRPHFQYLQMPATSAGPALATELDEEETVYIKDQLETSSAPVHVQIPTYTYEAAVPAQPSSRSYIPEGSLDHQSHETLEEKAARIMAESKLISTPRPRGRPRKGAQLLPGSKENLQYRDPFDLMQEQSPQIFVQDATPAPVHIAQQQTSAGLTKYHITKPMNPGAIAHQPPVIHRQALPPTSSTIIMPLGDATAMAQNQPIVSTSTNPQTRLPTNAIRALPSNVQIVQAPPQMVQMPPRQPSQEIHLQQPHFTVVKEAPAAFPTASTSARHFLEDSANLMSDSGSTSSSITTSRSTVQARPPPGKEPPTELSRKERFLAEQEAKLADYEKLVIKSEQMAEVAKKARLAEREQILEKRKMDLQRRLAEAVKTLEDAKSEEDSAVSDAEQANVVSFERSDLDEGQHPQLQHDRMSTPAASASSFTASSVDNVSEHNTTTSTTRPSSVPMITSPPCLPKLTEEPSVPSQPAATSTPVAQRQPENEEVFLAQETNDVEAEEQLEQIKESDPLTEEVAKEPVEQIQSSVPEPEPETVMVTVENIEPGQVILPSGVFYYNAPDLARCLADQNSSTVQVIQDGEQTISVIYEQGEEEDKSQKSQSDEVRSSPSEKDDTKIAQSHSDLSPIDAPTIVVQHCVHNNPHEVVSVEAVDSKETSDEIIATPEDITQETAEKSPTKRQVSPSEASPKLQTPPPAVTPSSPARSTPVPSPLQTRSRRDSAKSSPRSPSKSPQKSVVQKSKIPTEEIKPENDARSKSPAQKKKNEEEKSKTSSPKVDKTEGAPTPKSTRVTRRAKQIEAAKEVSVLSTPSKLRKRHKSPEELKPKDHEIPKTPEIVSGKRARRLPSKLLESSEPLIKRNSKKPLIDANKEQVTTKRVKVLIPKIPTVEENIDEEKPTSKDDIEKAVPPDVPAPKVTEETPVRTPSKSRRQPKRKVDDDVEDDIPLGKKRNKKTSNACGKCDYECAQLRALYGHFATAHGGLARLRGESQEFETEEEKEEAIKLAWKHSSRIVCYKCLDKKFGTLPGLKYHLNVCGVPQDQRPAPERVKCSRCDYTGLKASVKYHEQKHVIEDMRLARLKEEKERKEALMSTEVETSSTGRVKRRAATKTREKLAMAISELKTEKTGSDVDDSEEDEDFKMENEVDLVEKYDKIKGGKEFKCKFCDFAAQKKALIEAHLMEKHSDEVGDEEDVDETDVVDSDDEDFGGEEEDDDDDVVDVREKRRGGGGSSSRSDKPVLMNPCFKIMDLEAEFRQENYSRNNFENWSTRKSDWKILSEAEAEKYLPKLKESLPMSIASQDQANLEDQQLSRFSSCWHKKSEAVTLFAGGPIWAADWLPLEPGFNESASFLAVSTHHSMEDTVMLNKEYKSEQLIQIWKIDSTAKVCEMALGLAHNFGQILDMKWCPSGNQLEDADNDDVLARLGLLGVACSDGNVRIFSVCQPEDISDSVTPIALVNPVQTLQVPEVREDVHSQCLSLAWYRGVKHRVVAAGFSDGRVALWDLLKINENGFPYRVIHAHHQPVMAVDLSPDGFEDSDFEYPNRLVTGSTDRTISVWDLERDLRFPMHSFKKGRVSDVAWMDHYPSQVAVAYDDVFLQGHTQCTIVDFEKEHLRTGSIITQNSAVWSMSYNPWANSLAVVNSSGEAVLFVANDGIKMNEHDKDSNRRRCYLFRSELDKKEDTSEESNALKNFEETSKGATIRFTDYPDHTKVTMEELKRVRTADKMAIEKLDEYPLLSMNKVCQNTNLTSMGQIFCGGNSGIGRIVKTQGILTNEVKTKIKKLQKNTVV